MKSLSFKLEFFLLKGKKKKEHDDGDDGECIKMSGKIDSRQRKRHTHRCFFTAENFSETMCFKKLKQKKKI